jgi:hypothetical protein
MQCSASIQLVRCRENQSTPDLAASLSVDFFRLPPKLLASHVSSRQPLRYITVLAKQ